MAVGAAVMRLVCQKSDKHGGGGRGRVGDLLGGVVIGGVKGRQPLQVGHRRGLCPLLALVTWTKKDRHTVRV